ncbi:hypothetical protein ALC60_11921 [Trachymyrmex zeteki]|uniref:Uncharacterized protein n=1 Tax=Mycetomoellerius zeteki TaxID=64791 RepID=A0A151WLV8_9HYME|nr:hypothetical protein ALC60_11921 [Trachymyrmex zeteki]
MLCIKINENGFCRNYLLLISLGIQAMNKIDYGTHRASRRGEHKRWPAAPVFPYVPINQLLSIVAIPANELENCQSGPITTDASVRESQ